MVAPWHSSVPHTPEYRTATRRGTRSPPHLKRDKRGGAADLAESSTNEKAAHILPDKERNIVEAEAAVAPD